MLTEVKQGDKILASQYNELLNSLGGPINPSDSIPFTGTKTGPLLNGGITSYVTKAASYIPALLQTEYTTGSVGFGYNSYNPNNPAANRFTGVFLNIGTYGNFISNIGKLLNFRRITGILTIIDPTNEQPTLVLITPTLFDQIQNGKLPICLVNEDAALAIIQIVKSPGSTVGRTHQGSFVFLVGNFEKLGASDGGDQPVTVPRQTLVNAIKTIPVYSDAEDVRILDTAVLWKGSDWLSSFGSSTPNLTYNIGARTPTVLPDSFLQDTFYNSAALSTHLHSIDIVPPEQLGFDPLIGAGVTNTIQLYNFDKKTTSEITLSDTQSLSAYDLLVKHKADHPLQGTGQEYENQCSATLEYIPLSSILSSSNKTGDAQVPTANLSSIDEKTNGLSSSYFSLYGFENQGLSSYHLSDDHDFDFVIREGFTLSSGKRTNYVGIDKIIDMLSNEVFVLDNVSLSVNDDNKACIKGWHNEDAEPLSGYNLSDLSFIARDELNDNELRYFRLSELSTGGSNHLPGPWEISIDASTGNATFTNCVARVARAYHFFGDQSYNVGGSDVIVCFIMTHEQNPQVRMYSGSYSSVSTMLAGSASNCLSATITPLYRLMDNKVVCDYRYMMNIQAYDNRQYSSTLPA